MVYNKENNTFLYHSVIMPSEKRRDWQKRHNARSPDEKNIFGVSNGRRKLEKAHELCSIMMKDGEIQHDFYDAQHAPLDPESWLWNQDIMRSKHEEYCKSSKSDNVPTFLQNIMLLVMFMQNIWHTCLKHFQVELVIKLDKSFKNHKINI